MEYIRGEYAKKYSLNVENLIKRYHNGEGYALLQTEFRLMTQSLIEKCFKYRIGDILTTEPEQSYDPVNYNIDYCFNNVWL